MSLAALPLVDEKYRDLFANAPFRWLFAGRIVSVVGDNLYFVAAMWLVFELTGSTVYTGLAGFLSRAPGALSVFVGPLVDRWDLRRVLVGSELAQGVVVLVVPLAAALDALSVWVVLATMPVLALANLFAGPAQHATLPRILDSGLLVRANSAFSVVKQAVSAAGRGAGGLLVATVGAVAMYVVDAVTFAVAAVLFLAVRVGSATAGGETVDGEIADEETAVGAAARSDSDAVDPGANATDSESVPESVSADGGVDDEPSAGERFAEYRENLVEGIGLVTGTVLAHMILAVSLANFLAGVSMAVMPAFADTFGGATSYGLLVGAMSAGSLVGSLAASTVETYPLGRVAIVGFLVSSVTWLGAVLAPGTWATVGLFALAWVPTGVYNVHVLAVLQSGVPDDLVGRVSAIIGSVGSTVGPTGLLVGGFLGDAFPAESVMIALGFGLSMTAIYWLVVPDLRRFPPTADLEPNSIRLEG